MAVGGETRRGVVAEEAWTLIERTHEAIVESVQPVLNEMSSAEWLFYLRRVAPQFDEINELLSTGPYTRRIAEALSTRSTTPPSEPVIRDGLLSFGIGPAGALALATLIRVAADLYELQSFARWTGKGATLIVGGNELPQPAHDPELEAAVRLWDQRTIEHGGDILGAAGLYRGTPATPISGESAASTVVVFGEGHGTRARDRWGALFLDLAAIPLLADEAVPVELRWPRDLVDLVVLSRSLLISPEFAKSIRNPRHPVKLVGYRLVGRPLVDAELRAAVASVRAERLRGLIPDAVPIDDADMILERQAAARPDPWPPQPGPVIRPIDDGQVFVDVVAAGHALQLALARPQVSGGVVNAWGRHFEHNLQVALDRSPWRPSERLRELRGRTLWIDGKSLTDVDAWGERDGVVLAVSAKSVPFDRRLDRGEFQAIRNLRTAALAALAAWDAKVATLRARPAGDNYDLTWAKEIAGVVVYPFAPFVPLGAATAEVLPGLRAISGAVELEHWATGEGKRTRTEDRPRSP
jgi:hypothetical protein